MIADTAIPATRKRKSRPAKKVRGQADKPAIVPGALYNRAEAMFVLGVSQMTLFRAYDAGHLAALRVGRNILHSGQQLLDWLAAGGKTGKKI
jgi:hypothetical protein